MSPAAIDTCIKLVNVKSSNKDDERTPAELLKLTHDIERLRCIKEHVKYLYKEMETLFTREILPKLAEGEKITYIRKEEEMGTGDSIGEEPHDVVLVDNFKDTNTAFRSAQVSRFELKFS